MLNSERAGRMLLGGDPSAPGPVLSRELDCRVVIAGHSPLHDPGHQAMALCSAPMVIRRRSITVARSRPSAKTGSGHDTKAANRCRSKRWTGADCGGNETGWTAGC